MKALSILFALLFIFEQNVHGFVSPNSIIVKPAAIPAALQPSYNKKIPPSKRYQKSASNFNNINNSNVVSYMNYNKIKNLRGSQTITTNAHNDNNEFPKFQPSSTKLINFDNRFMEKLQDELSIPSEDILSAVEQSGSRVTAADISARTGVSIEEANKDLNTLATFARGNVQVSDQGDLVYSFQPNFRETLNNNSNLAAFRQLWLEKIQPYAFYALRVGVGVGLVISVVITFFAIYSLNQQVEDQRRDERRRDRGGPGGNYGGYRYNPFSPTYFFQRMFWDWIFYRPYYGFYGSPYYRYYAGTSLWVRPPPDMSFFDSIFSVVFGDGDPNKGLEEEQLRLAALKIREQGGVITAEELAPYYTLPEASDINSNSIVVDEGFMLPICTALNGEPIVTNDGDIIYEFPDLAPTTKETVLNFPLIGDPLEPLFVGESEVVYQSPETNPKYIRERPLIFSEAEPQQKLGAAVLIFLNVVFVTFFGFQLLNIPEGYELFGIAAVVSGLYPFLLLYAIALSTTPVFRFLRIRKENVEIDKRNINRKLALRKIERPNAKLQNKLKNATVRAKQLLKEGRGKRVIGIEDIIFDSDNVSEQLNQKEIADFDNRLNNNERNNKYDIFDTDSLLDRLNKNSTDDYDTLDSRSKN